MVWVPLRQVRRNAQAAYRACRLPWIGHIDVDEFLWPSQPVAQILGSLPSDQWTLRMEPHEAMHDPTLRDDIFTARAFRAPLKPRHAHLRAEQVPEDELSRLLDCWRQFAPLSS